MLVKRHRDLYGLTLVEFIVVMVLAALFLTLAIPSYHTFIQNNRVISTTNKLVASLQLARLEAVKRGVHVAVCPAASSALNACGSNTQWGNGWLVFIDEDNDHTIDASEDLIKIEQAEANGTTISSTSTIISYNATGFLDGSAASLSLRASGCSGNNARVIDVSTSGRVSIRYTSC